MRNQQTLALPSSLLEEIIRVFAEFLETRDAFHAAINAGWVPSEFKNMVLVNTTYAQRQALMRMARNLQSA